MITALRIEGFKSWNDTGELPFGRFAGFFGTNSSGKTSLLQLLLMLKQTSESADRSQVLHLGDERTLVGLGLLSDILHEHRSAGALAWKLSWQLGEDASPFVVPNPDQPKKALAKARDISFEARVLGNGNNGSGHLETMTYDLGGYRFTYRARGKTSKSGYELLAEGQEDFFRKARGRPRHALPSPAKCYGFPDEVRVEFQNAGFLADLELGFERMTGRILYLGPLRAYPRREYTWAGARPEDMGARGERWVDALLASREQGRKRHWGNKTLEEYVAWWLEKLGLIHSFRVEPVAEGSNLYRVLVRTTPRSSEVLVTEVGFGVSQILPVIVLCFYAPEGSTVLLEQPEIHLHPAVQAGLADVMLDAIKKRRVQIVLESHSEHLLRRLQRRIAEGQLDSADATLYFCRMEGGASRADRLRLNLFGYVENWPEGFFGDQMDDVMAMSEAAQQRERKRA
jgi:predicted ATPase